MEIGKDVPRDVVVSAGPLPVFHALDALPPDPENPGARLVPESGWIEVEPGLCYQADPKVFRSMERLKSGMRWTTHALPVGQTVREAPMVFDARSCTFSVGTIEGSA